MLEGKSQAVLCLHDKDGLYPVDMEFKDRLSQARKAKTPKLTQSAVADALGVSPQAVSGWERGEAMPEPDKLVGLGRILGVDVGWLLSEAPDAVGPALDIMVNPPRTTPPEMQPGVRNDFPIYASAEGGPGEIIRSTDPIDFRSRPSVLQNVQKAYGLIVTGDSMSPEYRNGDTALVNPHLPAIGGEVFIFYSERDGEVRATIKHLRRFTAEKWFVTQHNPPDGMDHDFTLPRREWAILHRVVGKYSR